MSQAGNGRVGIELSFITSGPEFGPLNPDKRV